MYPTPTETYERRQEAIITLQLLLAQSSDHDATKLSDATAAEVIRALRTLAALNKTLAGRAPTMTRKEAKLWLDTVCNSEDYDWRVVVKNDPTAVQSLLSELRAVDHYEENRGHELSDADWKLVHDILDAYCYQED